jgi:hypothetical protein
MMISDYMMLSHNMLSVDIMFSANNIMLSDNMLSFFFLKTSHTRRLLGTCEGPAR